MNANPFAFLDEIQMSFLAASNHAKDAIADVDRYVMPPGTITFIRNDGTSTEPMQVGPVLVEVVTDIRSGQESAGPSAQDHRAIVAWIGPDGQLMPHEVYLAWVEVRKPPDADQWSALVLRDS